MQKDKKISLVDLFKSQGLLFPSNAEEVLAFEKVNNIEIENPKDWENPSEIIKRGKIKNLKLKNFSVTDECLTNLSLAAREGKIITDEIRKKMDNDREQSKNK